MEILPSVGRLVYRSETIKTTVIAVKLFCALLCKKLRTIRIFKERNRSKEDVLADFHPTRPPVLIQS